VVEIGSSDAPVVLGVSPFKTPWCLWAKLAGLIEPKDEESEVMIWGTRLQGEVLAGFAEDQRLIIYKEQPTAHHLTKPWMRATPDGLLMRYRSETDDEAMILVEVKCTASQPPPVPRVEWLVQAVHQRLVFESLPEYTIAAQYLVAFGGLRMVSWEVPRHQAAMDRVLREEERFLERVEKQDPPPVRAEDASVLHRAWPWSKPETVLLGDEFYKADAEYAQGAEMMKLGESMKARSQATIQAALGEAERGRLADGTMFSWKTTKNGQRRFRRYGQEENE
jgi:putative phage-type endonuclease